MSVNGLKKSQAFLFLTGMKMSARPWILSLVFAFNLIVLQLHGAVEKPNVVWIIADDMSPDTGAYGAVGVSTPNLDALAKNGRRFTRAYASAPVCSSSRSAFILGCYQTTTGLHAHDVENPQPLLSPYEPLPSILRRAGWFVTNAAAPGTERSGRVIKKGKTHYNFAHDPAVLFDGDDWRKRAPGQPFFAQYQITEPHRPFPIPKEFDEEKVTQIKLPRSYPDDPLMRRDWYAYQRSVETVDARVGAILEQLRAEGVLENTVVMFFADHGRPMPWGKQWLSVEGLHVPLIVSGPGVDPACVEEGLVSLIDLAPSVLALAGQTVPSWMEGRSVLGAVFPKRPYLFAARDRCGDAQDRIRAVIGEGFLFVRNFHPALSRLNWSSYKEESYPGMPLLRMLERFGKLDKVQSRWLAPTREEIEYYDLGTDPEGVDNAVSRGEYAEGLRVMHAALDQWMISSGDRGGLPDASTEPSLDQIQKNKRQGYQQVWLKRIHKAEPTDGERLSWWRKSYGLAE